MTRKRFVKLCMSLPYYDRNDANEYADRVKKDCVSYQRQWESEILFDAAMNEITNACYDATESILIGSIPLFCEIQRCADFIASAFENLHLPRELEENADE